MIRVIKLSDTWASVVGENCNNCGLYFSPSQLFVVGGTRILCEKHKNKFLDNYPKMDVDNKDKLVIKKSSKKKIEKISKTKTRRTRRRLV